MQYQFEELPFLTFKGLTTAYIDGTATIEYLEDGDWCVTEVTVEGIERGAGFSYARTIRSICPQKDPEIFALLEKAILMHEHDDITEAVAKQLVEDGTPLRTMRQEHGLSLSQMGVGRWNPLS